MIPIHRALAEMAPHFVPRSAERVPLEAALGRFLAEAVRARQDSPPFDNSAMDGYAVRSGALAAATADAPVWLPLSGESTAGGPLPPALGERTTMRIFTGAPVPPGGDAVVMQEDVTREGDRVRFGAPARAGAHIRRAGEDLQAGAVMLERHQAIGPGEIGLLASQRHAHVLVHRRPRVAILVTGDELREVSDPPEPGTIVDSNAHALAAQVRAAGGDPVVLPRGPDDAAVLTERIRDGLNADLLLCCGGVSVGEHDHVREALERAGVTLGFWKVAIKPGKPLTFGTRGGTPVVGLPGNPVSAMVTFEVLVRPGLRAMLGDPRPHPQPVPVHLARAVQHRPGRTEMLRARFRDDGPRIVAEPHSRQGSGALPSMVAVDGLVVLPAGRRTFEAHTQVWALPLGGGRGSDRSPFAPGGPLDEAQEDR
jgi:molybdopterin molybdotransferase